MLYFEKRPTDSQATAAWTLRFKQLTFDGSDGPLDPMSSFWQSGLPKWMDWPSSICAMKTLNRSRVVVNVTRRGESNSNPPIWRNCRPDMGRWSGVNVE